MSCGLVGGARGAGPGLRRGLRRRGRRQLRADRGRHRGDPGHRGAGAVPATPSSPSCCGWRGSAPAQLYALQRRRWHDPALGRGERLVLASHNPGKLRELAALLAPFGIGVVSAGALGLPEPEETEPDFAGNARLKAVAAATASGLPALADDSGFCVAALGGAPGVLSARWAGPEKDFAAAMARVNRESGRPRPRLVRLRPVPGVAGRRHRQLPRPGGGPYLLAAARDHRLRLRRDVRAGGRQPELRRDRPGREARRQPPRAGIRGDDGRLHRLKVGGAPVQISFGRNRTGEPNAPNTCRDALPWPGLRHRRDRPGACLGAILRPSRSWLWLRLCPA